MRLAGGLISVLVLLILFVELFDFTLENTERTAERSSGIWKTLRSKKNDYNKDQ